MYVQLTAEQFSFLQLFTSDKLTFFFRGEGGLLIGVFGRFNNYFFPTDKQDWFFPVKEQCMICSLSN